MSRIRLIALLVALITLVVYLPAVRFDFLCYDDDAYVTDNPMVQGGLTVDFVRWAFVTGRASNWHPLTWISHAADCTLFGLNPGPHHLVNVIFHAMNSSLLFLLLVRLTRKIRPSALVAALFAWHPLHVESVAWVAERKDVLSTFFAMLTLLAYARYATTKSRAAYWAALSWFALGLMSKPMLVTLPCVMLLLDYWPLQRFSTEKFPRALVLEKIPFFLLTLASCVMTFCMQQRGHAVATLDQFPPGFRLENAVTACAVYLAKLFWPSPLAAIYPSAPIPSGTLICAVLALAAVSVFAWLRRKTAPCWLVGWLWFLGMLVPVIGLVQVGSAAMADRYTYLPSVGVFMALAFGIRIEAANSASAKRVFSCALGVLLVLLLARMEWQLQYWRNTETLFRHALAVTRDNDKAHLNLAITLDQQDRYAGAIAEYQEALRINPGRFQLHYNIGCLLDKMNRPAGSLAEFREALKADPDVATWHLAAGIQLAALGRTNEALPEFSTAIRLDPQLAGPHLELARIYYLPRGSDELALDELRLAARAEPQNFQVLATVAHFLAANENAAGRDPQTALSLARQADGLSGHLQPRVLDILGMACAANGNFADAITSVQNAIELAEAAQLKDTAAMQKRLLLYRNRQPWRESFRATNAPAGP